MQFDQGGAEWSKSTTVEDGSYTFLTEVPYRDTLRMIHRMVLTNRIGTDDTDSFFDQIPCDFLFSFLFFFFFFFLLKGMEILAIISGEQ